MADAKITRRECEKARRKAFFPKKSIPVWIVFALLIGLTVFCYNPMSEATADFIHEHFHTPYINITLPILEVVPIGADVIIGLFFAAAGLAFLLMLITFIRFILRKQSSKVEIIAFYVIIGTILIITFLSFHSNFITSTSPIETRMGFERKTFTEEEKTDFAEIIIKQVNALSLQVPRDENGQVIVDKQNFEIYKDALRNISDTVPSIDGYYITPRIFKDALKPYVVDNTLGKTENISHIIWYSDAPADLYFPLTIIHETAHSQGYGKEREAEFICVLACINSGDVVMEYAGWLKLFGSMKSTSAPENPVHTLTNLTDEFKADYNYLFEVADMATEEYKIREKLTDEEFQILKYGVITTDGVQPDSGTDVSPYLQDVEIMMAYFEAHPERLEAIRV
jgi:hypothetical protein